MLLPEILELFARQHGTLASYQLSHLSNADRRRISIEGRRLGQMHLVTDLSPDDVTTDLDIPTARPEPTIL